MPHVGRAATDPTHPDYRFRDHHVAPSSGCGGFSIANHRLAGASCVARSRRQYGARCIRGNGGSAGPCTDRNVSALRAQQRLDRAALVHRSVTLRHLGEGEGEVEDLARVDLPTPDRMMASVGWMILGVSRSSNRTSRAPYRTAPCMTASSPRDPGCASAAHLPVLPARCAG
jgi:hypothetical protein